MTRKTLGMLVLTPVLFFALERAIGSEGNGTDNIKRKQNQESARFHQPSQSKLNSVEKESWAEKTKSIPVRGTSAGTVSMEKCTWSRWEKLIEMKKQVEMYETKECVSDIQRQTKVQHYSNSLPAIEVEFLKGKFALLEELCPQNLRVESFSRCPSGHRMFVNTDGAGNSTQTGCCGFFRGCTLQPLAYFRYDAAAGTIECRLSDAAGYISFEEYFELYKEAQG